MLSILIEYILQYKITIAITITGLFIFRKFVEGPFYRKTNRVDGKVVIITGCNTGIGKETALELAKRGATIYMACRNYSKCEETRIDIIRKSNNQNIFNRILDLESLDSVREFAKNFLNEETRLDILIANAGIMAVPKSQTKDGFEQHFGVNHLGHFLLVNLLMDRLKSSASGRIVIVSSLIYLLGSIHKNDLMFDHSYYSGFLRAYPQSKLANILFTRKLAKMLKGTNVTINCCHPGCVRTDLLNCLVSTDFLRMASYLFLILCFKTPKAGAQTSIRLALDPNLEGVSGNFYIDSYIKCPLLPKAKDENMADWLWKKSEELVEKAK